MKKLAYLALAVALMYSAYEYTRPAEKIAVRATVGAGDTLWGIVTAAMKQTGDRRPVDEVIYYTRKTNKLTPADVAVLVIGTELVIPCEVRK